MISSLPFLGAAPFIASLGLRCEPAVAERGGEGPVLRRKRLGATEVEGIVTGSLITHPCTIVTEGRRKAEPSGPRGRPRSSCKGQLRGGLPELTVWIGVGGHDGLLTPQCRSPLLGVAVSGVQSSNRHRYSPGACCGRVKSSTLQQALLQSRMESHGAQWWENSAVNPGPGTVREKEVGSSALKGVCHCFSYTPPRRHLFGRLVKEWLFYLPGHGFDPGTVKPFTGLD
ncbi:uncharacterized protein LOC126986033 [Eriocheir sinensis]|uniref:uncharacterized protein LOC126986033 n=1 Tax=Eriocheir sinensis TaxID=95602 RepID=UPI0021C5EC87|nr:uncharacterized protein LOC126986033 [Eriocheir sinensis]